jgi:phospholipase/carboxylesterase
MRLKISNNQSVLFIGGLSMKSPLEYTVHLPIKIEEGKNYPVLYALHGRGTNEHDILPLVQELQNEFILIGIRGGVPEGPGFAYFYNISHGNPDRESFDQAVKNLESFMDYAVQTYPIDNSQQYFLGFSQGAILSMTLALRLGNKIKGIIAMNGYIPKFVKDEYTAIPMDCVSIYLSHGETDHVYPIEYGVDNARFFQAQGYKMHFSAYPIGHGITYENKEEFIDWLHNDRKQSNTIKP